MQFYTVRKTTEIDDKNTLVLTADEVQNYVHAAANRFNYGYFRYWEENGTKYYDCGPVTFIVTPVKDRD